MPVSADLDIASEITTEGYCSGVYGNSNIKLVACCDTCISQLFLETSSRKLQGPFKVMAILHHSTEQLLAGFMKF